MTSISDFIGKLKGALQANQPYVIVKNTKLVVNVINILYREGYLIGYKGDGLNIIIRLRYPNGNLLINDIECVFNSKRFLRSGIFLNSTNYNPEKGSPWLAIFSTSQGIITDRQLLSRTSYPGILLFVVS